LNKIVGINPPAAGALGISTPSPGHALTDRAGRGGREREGRAAQAGSAAPAARPRAAPVVTRR